ncbi:MAG: adenosylcobinamide-GDP ribazoletransferase [Spirochaetia bacterium]
MIFRGFFSALAFLTVIPIPDFLKSRRENGMFVGYPAAGLVIGVLLAAAAAGAEWIFPPPVAAVLLTGVSVLLTGAIHLDGLADCADAFYGSRDRETVLSILKDPRIGTMGGAAIGLSLLLRAASFLSLPAAILIPALPVMSMFSRATVLAAMRVLPYVRAESGIISSRETSRPSLVVLAVAVTLLAAALFPVPVCASLVACILFWRLSWKKIGGCTGDVLGATIEIAEIVFLLGMAAEARTGFSWGGFVTLARLLPSGLFAAPAP